MSWRAGVVFSILLVSFGFSAWAEEIPTDPILRIETGMHSVMINRIGIDRAERILVTASDDKTLRLWSLPDGRPLRVLRVPIGEGNEGKVYAGAISPDGSLVAGGGHMRAGTDGQNIFLFDVASGRLVSRIPGIANTVLHLSFSADGTYLAAALGGGAGIRVWRTSDWTLAFEDLDYQYASYWVEFARDGRMVSSCEDGYIRLYDKGFRLIAKQPAPDGTDPLGASFSPDGTRIAVGYSDTPAVSVLSSRDLGVLYHPNPDTTPGMGMGNVAWSVDGDTLYAGSRTNVAGKGTPLRRWSGKGRGAATDTFPSQNTIMDLHPLTKGGLVIASSEPAFSIQDAKGREVLRREGEIGDFRGNAGYLLFSHDGTSVAFNIDTWVATGWQTKRMRFSLHDRDLAIDPPSLEGLNPPLTEVAEFTVGDWENGREPTFNGTVIPMDRFETARSLAISPDHRRFLLGTGWSLRYYDATGASEPEQLWTLSTPGETWGVNISGDGRVAVAMFGDGSVRWYRLEDGQELLALFIHKDGKRWVAWTPRGQFMAPAGGSDLMGWHVNRGPDQAADFFPAARFRSVYDRPDVVEAVIDALDPDEAVAQADAVSGRQTQQVAVAEMLPPVVSILSPANGSQVSSSTVTVRYAVRSSSGEKVTGVRVLVDGRMIQRNRGISLDAKSEGKGSSPPLGEGEQTVEVPIPEHDVEIAVIAENRHAASEPAVVRVKWQGAAPRQEFSVKPKLYVLAIGVSDYQSQDLRLDYAAKDARDFSDAMAGQKSSGLYRDVKVRLLTDGEANKDEILDSLDWLLKETTSKDVAMLFLAGHGVNDRNGNYYYVPHDGDPGSLRRSGVAYHDIKDALSSLAGKAVFFVDTCHAGNVIGDKRRGTVDIDRVANDLSGAENGVVVFASSTGRQFSLERNEWGNGAFTKALVEGLAGGADFTKDGAVTLNELDLYLSERVKTLTEGEQTPTTTKPRTVPDFPVVVVK